MKLRFSLFVPLACFAFSVSAHASDLTFNITDGSFAQTGTYSGTFVINSATEMLEGGSVTATVDGTSYNFSKFNGDSPIKGQEIFTDSNGDRFVLGLDGNIGALEVNTVPIWGTSDTNFTLAVGPTFDALTGSVTQVVAPEPSSLWLLGTGALGLAAFYRRRRFLNA